jgi:hypothetical protein
MELICQCGARLEFLTVHVDSNEAFRHMQDVFGAERPWGNAEYLQRA